MKKRELKAGNLRFITIILLVIVAFASIFIFFNSYFNKVYNIVLTKDMEQIEWTSHYVTKVVESEIERNISNLRTTEEMFQNYEEYELNALISELQEIKSSLDFETIGLAGLDGKGVDNSGADQQIEAPELLEAISNGEEYVSNILGVSDNMLIAIPLHENEKIVGMVWGQLAVSTIARKIEMNDTSHRYFQIIDDNGQYISSSTNIYSFAESLNLWEEMERYEFSNGVTVADVQQNVENGGKGTFHFSYKGQGRYVTYEPLGINNWYVFSVVVEDFLSDYVKEIEMIFGGLLFGLSLCLLFAIGGIGIFIYKSVRTIREQNKQMQIKNRLLSMILKKTNDILFEVDTQKKQAKIYHHSLAQEEINYEEVNDISPETLIKREVIKPKDYDKYKKFYNQMMEGTTVDPIVMPIKLEEKWDYNKVHTLAVDKNYVIGFFEDYNEQILQDKKIAEISKKNQMDMMTTLYSREYFIQKVEQELRRSSSQRDGICALFLLDLDHFKEVNDTLGHIVGDRVLMETGVILKSIVRSTDFAGRLGGDEFVLFIQGVTDIHGLEKCAEKLISSLRRNYKNEEHSVVVSASVGIVPVTTEKTFEELYETADKALYEVKKTQKDGYKIRRTS